LQRNWYEEVPSSAGGLLVYVAGGVDNLEVRPFVDDGKLTWSDVAPTIVGASGSSLLAATPVLGGYFWLAWPTAPDPGQYELNYQSWRPREQEWQPASFNFKVIDASEPPLTWGTLSVQAQCGYGPAAGFWNDVFHIRIDVAATVAPEFGAYSEAILTQWVVSSKPAAPDAMPSAGAQPPRLSSEMAIDGQLYVLCDPYAFLSDGFDEPEVPRWVQLLGLVAGQASPPPLQQQLELSCTSCNWEETGAPPDAIAVWHRVFDTATATSASAPADTAPPPEGTSVPQEIPSSPQRPDSTALGGCSTAWRTSDDDTWPMYFVLAASLIVAVRRRPT
jgi:hypothetical protein